MKGISQRLSLAAVVVAAVSLAVCLAQFRPARAAREHDASSQSLRGRAASDYLKQSGLYDALAASSSTFAEQSKLLADDAAAQDNFGFSVAVSGDTAVVGSPRDQVGSNAAQGSAYVYVRANGVWTQQQKLTASDGAVSDEFGYAVAIEGDTIFVGRHNTQQLSNRTRGAVYVYTRSGTTWTQGPSIQSSDGVEGDTFGVSLAVDGDTLVAGAQLKNNGTTFFQGAAYVFTGAGANWTQQAKLLADDGGFANYFSTSVAVSGNTIVVGAPGQLGVSADSGRGSAYVFTRSGSTWAQQQKLLASDGAAGDTFGFSVGVSGDTAVVGARTDTVNGVGAQGSAYVFTRSGTTWAEQQHLFGVEQTQRNDQFGYSVAIVGDTIAVGSPLHEIVPGIANHGAVYVFTRSGSTWARKQKLIHSDTGSDALGQAVAFDGSSVIAGAPAKNVNRGAAYVFNLIADAGQLTSADGLAGDRFGHTVAVSGDTIIVGAPQKDASPINDRGAAYVFVRDGNGWSQQAKLTTPNANNFFGSWVAIDGDTAVVGVDSGAASIQGADVSMAYVFTRTGSTWTEQSKLNASDGQQHFASSVAIEGDTVVVGARSDNLDADGFPEGAAYVFTRSGTAWTQQQRILSPNLDALPGFGFSVDINGNSIAVGAPTDSQGNPDETARGAAYVFTRAGTTWTLQQRILSNDTKVGQEFGVGVGISGDTVLVGAHFDDPNSNTSTSDNQGSAYVFTRSGTAWTQQQKLTPTDAALGDEFGYSVALEGDTAVIGARLDSFGTSPNVRLSQGSAYVFRRSGATWAQAQKLSAFDGAAQDQFGWTVALSGTTAVVGAYLDDVEGKTDQGSAYVFTLEGGTTPTPTPTPTATPTPEETPSPTPVPMGTVQFDSASYSGDEGAGTTTGASFGEAPSFRFAVLATGSVTLTVTRTDATQEASVDFDTQDGTASSRSDYTAVSGTLRFATGETSKTIVTPLTDDRFEESQETFSVVLSNPVGVSLGSPSSATVQVTSDDTETGPSPVSDPNFDVDFFVRQHYADFLGREADAEGLAFWKNEITQCETRPESERQGCREVRRINVSAAFFLSIEFQQTGFYVYLLHQAAFASGEHLSLRQFNADVGEARRGVIVGQGNWQQQLDANKQALALLLVRRQTFKSAYPASLTPAQFVDALNANTGGSLSQSERDARVAELTADNTDAGRANVLRKITDNVAFRARESNRAFVLMQYFGYLRREPDDTPNSDFTGYNFWLAKLDQFNGNFIAAEMVKAFITSDEYKKRFGQ